MIVNKGKSTQIVINTSWAPIVLSSFYTGLVVSDFYQAQQSLQLNGCTAWSALVLPQLNARVSRADIEQQTLTTHSMSMKCHLNLQLQKLGYAVQKSSVNEYMHARTPLVSSLTENFCNTDPSLRSGIIQQHASA